MTLKKGLQVANIRVAGKKPLRQRLVGRHVGDMDHENKVRTRRHPVALLDAVVERQARFECVQQLGALPVERNLDQRG